MPVDVPCSLDTLVEAYTQHYRRTRGLRGRTLHGYGSLARLFLGAVFGADPIDPTRIRPSDVVTFVGSLRDRYSPRSMKSVRTALRSLFRFLRVEGLADGRLEAAIPAVAYWRLATLPRCLRDDQLAQVFASLHASTPCGQRDRAIVVCLAALGLRPREIADLCLEDLDWRTGVIHLRTRKTGRGATLPLPREAGRTLVAYLRHCRPTTASRRVFVQLLGIRCGTPLSSTAISEVVSRVLRRAHIEAPLAGAYLFRHTLASRLVRQGASLKEVADVLGHRSLDTTTIYAKLDLPALRDVGLPWPEVTQ